jgi:hypothetical protein
MMNSTIYRLFASLGLLLCCGGWTSSANAPAGICAFQGGLQVCHNMSAKLHSVNLSFGPNRFITIQTEQAMVCATNYSGMKRVYGQLAQPGGGNPFEAHVSNHSDSCTEITRLRLNPAGVWQLTIEFNDGDSVNFYFNVIDRIYNGTD